MIYEIIWNVWKIPKNQIQHFGIPLPSCFSLRFFQVWLVPCFPCFPNKSDNYCEHLGLSQKLLSSSRLPWPLLVTLAAPAHRERTSGAMIGCNGCVFFCPDPQLASGTHQSIGVKLTTTTTTTASNKDTATDNRHDVTRTRTATMTTLRTRTKRKTRTRTTTIPATTTFPIVTTTSSTFSTFFPVFFFSFFFSS